MMPKLRANVAYNSNGSLKAIKNLRRFKYQYQGVIGFGRALQHARKPSPANGREVVDKIKSTQ